jgi:hypothetical protein
MISGNSYFCCHPLTFAVVLLPSLEANVWLPLNTNNDYARAIARRTSYYLHRLRILHLSSLLSTPLFGRQTFLVLPFAVDQSLLHDHIL